MDDMVDPLTLNHKINEILYLMMLFIIKKLNLLKNNIF